MRKNAKSRAGLVGSVGPETCVDGGALPADGGTYPISSLGLLVLPVMPLIRPAYPDYRARPLQAAVEVLLGFAALKRFDQQILAS